MLMYTVFPLGMEKSFFLRGTKGETNSCSLNVYALTKYLQNLFFLTKKITWDLTLIKRHLSIKFAELL